MQWITTVEGAEVEVASATKRALTTLETKLGCKPDLVLAFVASTDPSAVSQVVGVLSRGAPEATRLGCSAGGVIGGGREAEGRQTVALVGAKLPGVRSQLVYLTPEQTSEPDEISKALKASGDDLKSLVVLPDPFTASIPQLLSILDSQFPGVSKVGALASGLQTNGKPFELFTGEEVHPGGAAILSLEGAIHVETVVAQGCRPIGQPRFVTRVNGQLLLELDGRPVVEVLEELLGGLSVKDRELASKSLFLGIVAEESTEVYRTGDFLIRNVLGLDEKNNGLAISTRLQEGWTIQFHLRDAKASSHDLSKNLKDAVERLGDRKPSGALLFSCLGRGEGLYGVPDYDSGLFEGAFGSVPLGGFFGNGEIGPVKGSSYLHGYTSVFALMFPEDSAVS